MREAFRRRLIEELAEKAVQKVGSEVKQWFSRRRAASKKEARPGMTSIEAVGENIRCGMRDRP